MANRVCQFDGRCFRRDPQHYVDFGHPIERTKPMCTAVLRCERCFDKSDAHVQGSYHGPSATVLERVAQGLSPFAPAIAKRIKTTTLTLTTTTTLGASAVADSAPKMTNKGGALRQNFVCPPFSVPDAGQGPWQSRKKEWLGLGIDSGAGRANNLLGAGMAALTSGSNGTSLFDPVLAECALRWYAPTPVKGGTPVVVLDTCAGGSVRGIVAAMLGFAYCGVDCSTTQIREDEAQALSICGGGRVEHMPYYAIGDGVDAATHFASFLKSKGWAPDTRADFVILCPPYGSLEQYGGDPAVDLSMMTPAGFKERYAKLLGNTTALLKEHHVSVTVIGNVRDASGALQDLHGQTKAALAASGNSLYCDAILKTALASAPIRAGKQMKAAAKLCSVHQNLVVCCKGSPLTTALCTKYRIAPGTA